MRTFIVIVFLICGAGVTVPAHAEADRASLIKAWEAYMASLPSITNFEKTGDGKYRFSDTELPYEGELILHGALVRSLGTPDDSIFSHTGMLEFELADLPEERLSSQLYYYWIADKQMLYYSTIRGDWISQTQYTDEFSGNYGYDSNFWFMSFMMKYGIWILLIVLIVFLFRGVNTQMKKNRALMDDTAAINEKARENVDRAQAMQDEVLAISRQSLELQAQNNETLKKILEALSR